MKRKRQVDRQEKEHQGQRPLKKQKKNRINEKQE